MAVMDGRRYKYADLLRGRLACVLGRDGASQKANIEKRQESPGRLFGAALLRLEASIGSRADREKNNAASHRQ